MSLSNPRHTMIWSWLIPSLLTLALIGGWDLLQQRYAKPADVEPYHEQVRLEVERLPASFGGWVSETIEPQREAIQILKPNVILSRRYRNDEEGVAVTLLVVHCKESRDMMGHYPPVCYPSSGWSEREGSRRSVTFEVEGRTIPAMEYTFFQSLPGSSIEIHVINTLLLPDGTVTPVMDEVYALGADYRRRFLGAGQLQLVFYSETDSSRREAVAREFLEICAPVIEKVTAATSVVEAGESL